MGSFQQEVLLQECFDEGVWVPAGLQGVVEENGWKLIHMTSSLRVVPFQCNVKDCHCSRGRRRNAQRSIASSPATQWCSCPEIWCNLERGDVACN